MGEIRTTPHLSFNRKSISLNMNQTATLGGAPCLSNALHQHGTEITRGLASFQASLARSQEFQRVKPAQSALPSLPLYDCSLRWQNCPWEMNCSLDMLARKEKLFNLIHQRSLILI